MFWKFFQTYLTINPFFKENKGCTEYSLGNTGITSHLSEIEGILEKTWCNIPSSQRRHVGRPERVTDGLQETLQIIVGAWARIQPYLASRTLAVFSLDLWGSAPWLVSPSLFPCTPRVTGTSYRKALRDVEVPLLTSLPIPCLSFLPWPNSGLVTCVWESKALHLHLPLCPLCSSLVLMFLCPNPGFQSVVLGLATSVPPDNLLEMQIIWPYLRATE